jgi:erythromycin esterase-like protein
MARTNRSMILDVETPAELTAVVRDLAHPLEGSDDLDPLLEQIGDAHYVLLGEASHGTAEYYVWRTTLSKRLIREKGFSFIAVEADWPDCYRVNRFIKGLDGRGEHFGNYVPTLLPRRYDAFLYIDQTQALHPLPVRPREEAEVPETFPSGV